MYEQLNQMPDSLDVYVPDGFDRVIPIVFAANDKYAPYAGVAIESVKENVGPRNFYRIYILHTGLTHTHIRKLESLGMGQVSVQCLNINALLQSKRTELPVTNCFTQECYYRILLPEIFGFYPYVVYLDCDLIVREDIAGIIPEDMGDAVIAAVRDCCPECDFPRLAQDFDLTPEEYVNSGVLVFNIQKWNQYNITSKCFEMIRTTPAQKLPYPDQDVINAVCKGRVLYLDYSWNFGWGVLFLSPKELEIYKPVVSSISERFRIIHYTSRKKPWNRPRLPYADLFWDMSKKTPFYKGILIRYYSLFLPRLIRGGIMCFSDHGVRYTVRRAIEHLTGKP